MRRYIALNYSTPQRRKMRSINEPLPENAQRVVTGFYFMEVDVSNLFFLSVETRGRCLAVETLDRRSPSRRLFADSLARSPAASTRCNLLFRDGPVGYEWFGVRL